MSDDLWWVLVGLLTGASMGIIVMVRVYSRRINELLAGVTEVERICRDRVERATETHDELLIRIGSRVDDEVVRQAVAAALARQARRTGPYGTRVHGTRGL